MTDIYTMDEVAHHNIAQDLWIVIHGSVYNITEFQKEHPGGEEVLLQLGGQDATDCFESVGHSPEAINLREKFKIGVLMDGASSGKSKTTKTEIKEPIEDDWQYQEPNKEMASWNIIMFACAAAIIYAIIMFYWFKKL